jgi:hypothetical protein
MRNFGIEPGSASISRLRHKALDESS